MTNLAVIPARSGSQRIPKKNIKDFFGKPIIAYPIELALKSNLFDEVMVSTDSPEIESIAIEYGASVPFLRSEKNSNNFATLTDVILEVIHGYHTMGIIVDSICCILPTAVLISQKSLLDGYNKFKNNDLSSLIPVLRFAYPIQRALKDNSGLLSFREPEFAVTRSQDMEPYFHDSGQFYWIKTERIVIEKTIFTSKTGYIELAEIEAQDIDTQMDWDILSFKFAYKNKIMHK
jgi:N-acylneuraminate cytidylyltransferase